MAWFGKSPDAKVAGPVLLVQGLDVYYGRAHALQSVSLRLDHGVLGLVGRNGMGKTTLCNAIVGLVPAQGSIKLLGQEILGLTANEITQRGIAYVPQGRRVWPSLTVHETLRLVARHPREIDRVYAMFPRLAERKSNGGAQLSGGEQQMLAIGRALVTNPKLLILDEATEGLAPLIREEIWQCLTRLRQAGQTLVVVDKYVNRLVQIADRHLILERGSVAWHGSSAELDQDRSLWHRYLGV